MITFATRRTRLFAVVVGLAVSVLSGIASVLSVFGFAVSEQIFITALALVIALLVGWWVVARRLREGPPPTLQVGVRQGQPVFTTINSLVFMSPLGMVVGGGVRWRQTFWQRTIPWDAIHDGPWQRVRASMYTLADGVFFDRTIRHYQGDPDARARIGTTAELGALSDANS